MSQTVTISNDLFSRLEAAARRRGLNSVVQLLESWQGSEDHLTRFEGPLILAELNHEPDDWFWALHAITGASPVPAEIRGNVRQMTDAWLQWGVSQGYQV